MIFTLVSNTIPFVLVFVIVLFANVNSWSDDHPYQVWGPDDNKYVAGIRIHSYERWWLIFLCILFNSGLAEWATREFLHVLLKDSIKTDDGSDTCIQIGMSLRDNADALRLSLRIFYNIAGYDFFILDLICRGLMNMIITVSRPYKNAAEYQTTRLLTNTRAEFTI